MYERVALWGKKNHKYTPSQEEQEHMLFTRTQTARQAGLPGPESPTSLDVSLAAQAGFLLFRPKK